MQNGRDCLATCLLRLRYSWNRDNLALVDSSSELAHLYADVLKTSKRAHEHRVRGIRIARCVLQQVGNV